MVNLTNGIQIHGASRLCDTTSYGHARMASTPPLPNFLPQCTVPLTPTTISTMRCAGAKSHQGKFASGAKLASKAKTNNSLHKILSTRNTSSHHKLCFSISPNTSDAILRLEEAKQVLIKETNIDVETAQIVDLPRLEQQKKELEIIVQEGQLELEEMQRQLDEAKDGLDQLNDFILTRTKEQMMALCSQQQATNHVVSQDVTQKTIVIANLDVFSLIENNTTVESKDANCFSDNRSFWSWSTSSCSSMPTGFISKNKTPSKSRIHRGSIQSSSKKWRRMVRTNRLQSILLAEP